MALVGAGAVTLAALIILWRSGESLTNLLTVVLWVGYMAVSTGGVL